MSKLYLPLSKLVGCSFTGVDIDQKDLESLFQSFTRVDLPSHRTIKGSGLGLAIAKELTARNSLR